MFCIFLARMVYTGGFDWFFVALAAISITLYQYFTGNWSMIGYPLRYLLLAILMISLWFSIKTIRNKEVRRKRTGFTILQTSIFGFVGVFFSLIFLVVAILGSQPMDITTFAEEGAEKLPVYDLSFPLQGGNFYVGHGGALPNINYHNIDKAQKFALDIGALYAGLVRAKGIRPKELNKYAVYGAKIVSPCAGKVVSVKNNLPELSPPEIAKELFKEDRLNIAGNHVFIECDDLLVALAHMQPNSVSVSVNQEVTAGDFLGLVGNSGNTSLPHLHIHAVINDKSVSLEENIFRGTGVPIKFNGKFLLRNDVVKN